MSPSKTLLLHSSPNARVAPAWVAGASAVNPGSGVELKEMVGMPPVGDAALSVAATVAMGAMVFVGSGVDVGSACAVPVNWLESCATVVPTIDVLIAFRSCVGAGVAPKLHPARIRLKPIRMGASRLNDFRTSMLVPPWNTVKRMY